MDFSTAKERCAELIRQIEYYSKQYYEEDAPEIEDFEYDRLMRELAELEKNYPELLRPDSPTHRVGGKASGQFEPVEHTVRMESLQDAFDLQELYAFDQRVRESCPDAVYCVEPKIDGLSVSLEYDKGLMVRGSTRGDGSVGENVTANLKTIRSIPLRLQNAPDYLEVRGEVFMSHESFEKLLAYQELHEEPLAKNPRNAAAGSLRQKDSSITATRSLDIFLFNIKIH